MFVPIEPIHYELSESDFEYIEFMKRVQDEIADLFSMEPKENPQ